MIILNYRFKDIYGHFRTLQLSQSSPEDLWCISEEDVLLARLSRIQDGWKQLSGDALPKELIRGAGAFIQQNYYDSIPLQIKDRWPGIIGSAEKKSDSEITIVCKPQVNLGTFRSIFCKHVTRLFNQEICMDLKVYSYNFTQDFSFKLDVKSKRQA
ncbi:hypothetical protein [Pedobacter aquatilis]|uniref:hypothetical protein n=1 Tax=Pedobacter aquatilis TaxID=351343 RepID=UPI002930BFF9|nr:hypothetical protein [Pedobacter aquatilis]